SYCGCTGYVGTRNEFSLRNIQPLAQSLDSLGILSNDVLEEEAELTGSLSLPR
ncbi:amidase, partial [Alcaligenes faecalis subsp. faecalis NCIB 8687]